MPRVKAIFQLRVTLRDIDPPIWRAIQLAEDTKLSKLHRILQSIFNWEDYHLHDFRDGDLTYSVPDPEEDAFYNRKVIDERKIPLNRVLRRVGESFEYEYDFGDGWMHDLLLEAILLPSPGAVYPRCVGGARNGPPEDVGGPYAYPEYLEALADRKHDRHREFLEWRGRYPAEKFSLKAVNAALEQAFHPVVR